MKSNVWFRKALTLCLMVAIYATYSMTALAGADKIVGELTVSGKATESVKVNGEIAQSGRAIFSNSTIATSESANAVINVGKSGKIELAPNTVISLSFDEKGLTGNLVSGKVTALSADNVNIKMPNGNLTKLNLGESTTAGQTKDDPSSGGSNWWIYALVLGGAIAGIAIAATSDNNDIQLGGGSTVVSPTR